MEFPEYVPQEVRELLRKELQRNDAARESCMHQIAAARSSGIHRRFDIEKKRLDSLTFKRNVIKRIGSDPRMVDVYNRFEQSKNILNTPIINFIEKLISACKDYKFEEELIKYHQDILNDVSTAAKNLEILLYELDLETSFVKSFLELPATLQELQHFTNWHRDLVSSRTKGVKVARSSRKKNVPLRDTLRAIIYSMVIRDNMPAWTDGFFTVLALSVEVALDCSVSPDDARKAYRQVLSTMENNA